MQNSHPYQEHSSKLLKPIIPIVTLPSPATHSPPSEPHLNSEEELELYKREYSRVLRDNQKLLCELSKVLGEKEEL